MSYSTTNWQDRVVQFPNRYTKTNETVDSVTLSLDPGTITQAGTPVNAVQLNKLERGVFDAQLLAWMGGF